MGKQIAIIGAGNGGTAMAGDLTLRGLRLPHLRFVVNMTVILHRIWLFNSSTSSK